jgi:hypothetical protein
VVIEEPPLASYKISKKPSAAETLNNQKSDYEGSGYYKIKIEEPYFEKVVKADKCKGKMKSTGTCLLYRSKISKGLHG